MTMELFGDPYVWLPFTFAALMGLSILIYVVLDGFDLGVGVLFPFADGAEKDRMVSSIGPFWDANETWLVLAIGILLVAFPAGPRRDPDRALPARRGHAHRPHPARRRLRVPREGARQPQGDVEPPLLHGQPDDLAQSQGFMLGLYIMGLTWTLPHVAFACLTAVFLTVGYSFIGATWLILKTEGALQRKAVEWARGGIWGLILGIGAISAASPLVSPRIFEKWFSFPEMLWLSPLPILSAALILWLWRALRSLPAPDDKGAMGPFVASIALFTLAFAGLAYSYYPFVVPESLTIYEAASAPESLIIILVGVCFVLPTILAYTALAYMVFRGKATDLRYY
jgi:cytochrome bd ubiquinol oxidase subunit II